MEKEYVDNWFSTELWSVDIREVRSCVVKRRFERKVTEIGVVPSEVGASLHIYGKTSEEYSSLLFNLDYESLEKAVEHKKELDRCIREFRMSTHGPRFFSSKSLQ